MLENAFINFTATPQENCGVALPVKFGGSPISLNLHNELGVSRSAIELLNMGGDTIASKIVQHSPVSYININLADLFSEIELDNGINDGECFKLKFTPSLIVDRAATDIADGTNIYSDSNGRTMHDFNVQIGQSYAGKRATVQISYELDPDFHRIEMSRLYYGNEVVGESNENDIITCSFDAIIDNAGSVMLKWWWGVPAVYAKEVSHLNTYSAIITIQEGLSLYSNILKYVKSTDGLAYVIYKCNEDAFEFPFAMTGEQSALLPINIKNLQLVTKDEVYTNLNGENIVLYSTVTNEYDLETEYLSQDLHKKIVVALSCDHVWIDGMPVYKSGDYSIDWDNKTVLDCGEKIAKATSKVQENKNSRNSN